MKLSRVVELLEGIAPTHLAEPWDNVGLLAGDVNRSVSRVLLTIDYTSAVAREAVASRCDLAIAYHPPIFNAIKRLTAESPAFQAIASGIALYSPHTALDVAEGGTNDMLADVLGLTDRAPLRRRAAEAKQYKLVTFVPVANAEAVSRAIFAAGAGKIGDYSSCGFRSEGTGTFFGGEATNPAVGKKGRLEKAPEVRLETVVPIARVADVIHALRQAHPYEEPAFDLNQLAAVSPDIGMGRIGSLKPTPRSALIAGIKRGLKVQRLLVAGPTSGRVKRAAVCAGSCGSFLDDAIAGGAELFLTGEVRHHDAMKAAAAGMTVVCTLHSNSERPVLGRLKARLKSLAPKLSITVSRADRDPFAIF